MTNHKRKLYFTCSAFLAFSALVLVTLTSNGNNIALLYGDSSSNYTITLNAANAPTESTEYVDVTQAVRYNQFSYYGVKASPSNHVELSSNGEICNNNDSQITSITSVTANFSTAGSLTLITTWQGVDYFDYQLVSGTPITFPSLPYFVEFWAGEEPVTIESIIIEYSCTPHEESLDKYRVNWFNYDDSILEQDIDVEAGTFPSYDGPVPTKEPDGDIFYAFNDWNYVLNWVNGNQSYTATFIEISLTFSLINEGTEYMLMGVSDPSFSMFTIPSFYNGLPVTAIGTNAFSEFENLTSVRLPDTLTSIGESAFSFCPGLSKIDIPANVTYIGPTAFAGCPNLSAINVNASNVTFSSIDGVLFDSTLTHLIAYPNGKGTSYIIPNGTTTIGELSFSASTGLLSITIPLSVTTIKAGAFRACYLLNNVIIPSSVTTMEGGVFVACSSLTSIVIPNTVTSLGSDEFALCSSLTSVTLPSWLTIIGNSFFYGCTSLECLTIPNTITEISVDAFHGCTKLTSINFPEGLAIIGSRAFQDCSLLPSMVLPSTLHTINSSAFNGCESLTTMTIPSSVTLIGTYAFLNCSLLSAINVDSANLNYSSLDGVLFDKGMADLICYPKGKSTPNYVVPSSVTTIESNAFRTNSNLLTVYLPNSVTTILGYAFYSCTNLTINCQASTQPAGWDVNWNVSSSPVVWNYVI